jgi:hypothetical protein
MVHPVLLFAGLFVAKKAVAVSLYMAGKRYGWPRVYRRVLEYNKKLTPLPQQAGVVNAVKKAFHFPTQALQVIQSQEAYQFLKSYASYARSMGGLAGTATAKMAESLINAPSQWFTEWMPLVEKDLHAEQSESLRKRSAACEPRPSSAASGVQQSATSGSELSGNHHAGSASKLTHGALAVPSPRVNRPEELR